MFSRLDEFCKRHQQLTQKLGDPDIHANSQEYQKVAKEEAGIRPIVEAYAQYKKIKSALDDNRHLVEEEADAAIRDMAKQEIPQLEAELNVITETLKIHLLPKDPKDEKNIFLEIRAGTGGEEAALFATNLFRMYSRYAESQGWKVELVSSNETGIGGLKEMIVLISGERVYSRLKYESGIHRVQRVPRTEASGRIHTSAVTVAVMPEAEDVELDIKDNELRIDVFRAGGHGGQSVNTTDSAVRITYLPTNLVVICQDEKSQHKNRAKAMKVLRSRLLEQKQREQEEKESKERKEQVKSGDRSEKIRTYNYPQSRVTDHRIGLTLHQLETIMEGKLDSLIEPLQSHFQAEALKGHALKGQRE